MEIPESPRIFVRPIITSGKEYFEVLIVKSGEDPTNFLLDRAALESLLLVSSQCLQLSESRIPALISPLRVIEN